MSDGRNEMRVSTRLILYWVTDPWTILLGPVVEREKIAHQSHSPPREGSSRCQTTTVSDRVAGQ